MIAKLSDHERQLLILAVLAVLTRKGCEADPGYTALLFKLNGVDTVVSIDQPRGAPEEPVRWMTYAELGQARGISTASATRLTFRRKWRRQKGNDGIARVEVPVGEDRPPKLLTGPRPQAVSQ